MRRRDARRDGGGLLLRSTESEIRLNAALHRRLDRWGRARQPLGCGVTCRYRELNGMRKGQDIRRPSLLTATPFYFSSFRSRYAY